MKNTLFSKNFVICLCLFSLVACKKSIDTPQEESATLQGKWTSFNWQYISSDERYMKATNKFTAEFDNEKVSFNTKNPIYDIDGNLDSPVFTTRYVLDDSGKISFPDAGTLQWVVTGKWEGKSLTIGLRRYTWDWSEYYFLSK